jgi:saccharopine dehydrogenase-like NADP-dependent oxidoreductase
MIVLFHRFETEKCTGGNQLVTSTMVDYGEPDGDTAMARTVSLPAAIAAKLVSEDCISLRGVQIPVAKQIYEPVLNELASLGIVCSEVFAQVS